MLTIAAYLLLIAGAALELAGVAFCGLDLLVGLLFTAAMILGGASAIRSRLSWSGLIAFGLAALALGLHLYLNLRPAGG